MDLNVNQQLFKHRQPKLVSDFESGICRTANDHFFSVSGILASSNSAKEDAENVWSYFR